MRISARSHKKTVDALFAELVSLEDWDRAARLGEIRREDACLGAELEELLRADSERGDFLEALPFEAAAGSLETPVITREPDAGGPGDQRTQEPAPETSPVVEVDVRPAQPIEPELVTLGESFTVKPVIINRIPRAPVVGAILVLAALSGGFLRARSELDRERENAARHARQIDDLESGIALREAIRATIADVLSDPAAGEDVSTMLRSLSARIRRATRGDPEAEAALRITLANAFRARGNPEAALRELQRTLEIRCELHGDDDVEAAHVLAMMGLVAVDAGNNQAALSDIEEARRVYESIGHEGGLATCLFATGLLHAREGRPGLARSHFERAAARLRGGPPPPVADLAETIASELTHLAK